MAANVTKKFKIGLSATDKANMKAEIINTLRGELIPNLVDDDTTIGGIRFIGGALRGTAIGRLANYQFMSIKQDGTCDYGTMFNPAGDSEENEYFFDDDMFIEKDFPVYAKGGSVQLHDLEGNLLYTKMCGFKKSCIVVRTGKDNEGNEYEDILFRKNPDVTKGFEYDNSFRCDDGTFKDYMFFAKYRLAPVETLEGETVFISKTGTDPTYEVQPNLVVDPERDGDSEGLKMEVLFIARLYALCFNYRGAGDNAYGADSTTLKSNSSDIVGYTLNTTYGNDGSNASNKFYVQNSSQYSKLEVGDHVAIDTNIYSGGKNDSTTFRRTITAKEVGETYTEFTFDGDALIVGSKLLHLAFKNRSGYTDRITTLCGEDVRFSVGYRSHKIFGIEDFFNNATWLDWICWSAYYLRVKDSNYTASQYSSWKALQIQLPYGANYVKSLAQTWEYRDHNGNKVYNFPIPLRGASSATHYCGTMYFENNNNSFAVSYGRPNGDSKNYGLFHLASGVNNNSYNYWTSVASSDLGGGCWGRSFRSVKRRNAAELPQ